MKAYDGESVVHELIMINGEINFLWTQDLGTEKEGSSEAFCRNAPLAEAVYRTFS